MRVNLEGERWLPVNGFPAYEISDHGRVWNVVTKKFRVSPQNKYGYLQLYLANKKAGKMCTIHRLVAEHFVPNLYEDPQVNHMDGNKTNNYFGNLEWCTAKENTHHAMGIGLRKGTPKVEHFDEEDAWLVK